jgi:phosphoglycerate kinase
MGFVKSVKSLENISGKTAVVRVDINVPMQHGRVLDDTRITRVLPTINYLQESGCKVVLLSHFGRPKGAFEAEYSLAPLADYMEQLMGQRIAFGSDCTSRAAVDKLQEGGILLMENLRFHGGEEKNDPEFSKALADLGDFYVNEAFSCSHRAHASIEGITHHLPSYAGLSLEDEINNIARVLETPQAPFVAIVGGSKVSTKIGVLESLCNKVDYLIIGGAMANTFLAAKGYSIGKSLYEPDYIEIAKKVMQGKAKVVLPSDVVVSKEFGRPNEVEVVDSKNIPHNKLALDIGGQSIIEYGEILAKAKMLVWNGPLGAYEFEPFGVGTSAIARIVGSLTKQGRLVSVAGGGDILSAVGKAGMADNFTYISTAGGAFLEWLEGIELPGVARVRL